MDYFEQLSDLNRQHKKLLDSYDKLLKDSSGSDMLNEHKKLGEDLEKLKIRVKELEGIAQKLTEEIRDARNALVDAIIDEKFQLVKISREKLELYFGSKLKETSDRLSSFENELKNKIDDLVNNISKSGLSDQTELSLKFSILKDELNKKTRLQREMLQQEKEAIYSKMSEGMKRFQDEEVDEEIIKKRVRQNKLEMNIGLSWFNKIGIVLVLLSIGLFAYYHREGINDYVKGILFFVFGFAFLITGEIFYQRDRNLFARGLIGGGVAILFASLFSSCFILEIISQNTTLVLSVILALATLVLAIRYKSGSIMALGLIGGYLPFITYNYLRHFSGNDFYYGMAYLLILNLITLGISLRMKWIVINYLSFVLFIPSLIYLAFNCPSPLAGIIFTSIAFLIYIAIVLGHPVLNKTAILKADIVMFALNAAIGSLILFLLFEKNGWEDYEGMLAGLLGITFYGTARVIKSYLPEDRALGLLSYITSLTFAVLIIPFQFNAKWLSIGWLVEGILLIVFGNYRRIKYMEYAGLVVFAMCLVSFYLYDVISKLIGEAEFFALKFFFITSGLVFVYISYHTRKINNLFTEDSGTQKIYSFSNFLAVINFFFFSGYILYTGFDHLLAEPQNLLPRYIRFYHLFFWSFSAFLTAQVIRYRYLANNLNRTISILLLITANLIFLYMISVVTVLPAAGQNQYRLLGYLSFTVLIIFNLIIVYSIRETIIRFFKYNYTNLELMPLIIAIFLLVNISILIVRQFHFIHAHLVLSLSYVLLAAGCIIFGFYRKYTYIRYFGLGLTFFALGKLFIWDLHDLDETGKIIAYFTYGMLLIGISFVYQQIQKRLRLKNQEDTVNE